MKCEVKVAFTDKNTGAVHMAGETVDVTEARADELAKAGVIDKPVAKKAPARKAAPKAKKAE